MLIRDDRFIECSAAPAAALVIARGVAVVRVVGVVANTPSRVGTQ